MTKSWLVTGSGSGLGRALVEAALAKGEHVLAGARKPDELQALTEKFGDRITPVDLDVRDEEAAKSVVQKAVDLHGRLDVLVNNACYQLNAPFEQISTDDFKDVVQTCFWGAVYTSRAAVPVMRKQKSRLHLPGFINRRTGYHPRQFSISCCEMGVRRLQ